MDNDAILKRIRQVMQVEATVPTRRDFLLTHVPFRNLSLGDSEPITEEQLFEEKLLANPEDHKTIMILGENGSGKSHLIRWLYERYLKEYGEDNEIEKIIWISKAHNTLQDALMQLLKSDVFPEEIRKNELEKVRNAQSAISGVELKKTINFNFTLVVEDDNEKKVKSSIIDNVSRMMLPSYLRNEYILNKFLMRKNGPLDRICSKLNNVDNANASDFEGEVFVEDDFAITISDLKNHLENGENSADKFTINLAKRLMNNAGGKVRKSLADYMNSKVDEVIQRSLKLTTSDFKQLFWSLRTNLKQMGMRLTLFVEDINAFTGIDLALMDVLVANHEAEGNEDYCRLASVVGTTNDFYKNRLNDSLRDRVKDVGAEVYIREESLFGDPDRLTEFAAKYINASLLTHEDVELWERESDCDDRALPVAPVSYKFARAICQDKEMSIFPFNKNAIVNFYEKLDSLSKTPRRFLLDVVLPVLTIYYSSPEDFLENEEAFKNASITSLNNFTKPEYTIINDNVGGPDTGRRSLLLRMWGNATTEVVGDTVGGLDREIFDAFEVEMQLERFREYSEGKGATAPVKPDHQPKAGAETSTSSTEKQLPNNSVVTSKSGNNNDTAYSKIRAEIGEWAKKPNVKLSYANELRTCVSKFIYGNMEWDVEEIPHSIVDAYITIKYISIEGQIVNKRGEGITLTRSRESEYLFYALIGYKYLGNNSWEFEQGLEYYNLAMTWLANHHDEIMNLVRAPYENTVSYKEVLLASMYCVKLVNGGIKLTDNPMVLMQRLFDKSFNRSVIHSDRWNELYEKIEHVEESNKYRDKVVKMFSNVVGTADVDDTKYTFVDAHRIITILTRMIESNWDLSKYEVQSADSKKQDLWYKAPMIVTVLSRSMNSIVADEMSLVNKYNSYFKRKIPGYKNDKQVETALNKINDYLRYLTDKRNLSYEMQKVQKLREPSTAQYIVKEMTNLESIADMGNVFERLNAFGLNPFEHIKEIYEELQYFDQLIKEKNAKFRGGIDVSVNDQIEQYRRYIQTSIAKMIAIGEGGNT